MKNRISNTEKALFIKKTLPKIGRKRFLIFYIKLAEAIINEDNRKINEVYKALVHLGNMRLTKKKYVYLQKTSLWTMDIY